MTRPLRRIGRLAVILLAVGAVLLLALRLAKVRSMPHEPEYTLQHDGRERRYYVHAPRGWDGQQRLPVVLVFHGGGGNAEVTIRQTGMNDVADQNQFLAVYPEGTGRLQRRLLTWNAGRCCAYAVEHQIDDVGFVIKLLDDLEQQFPIDTERVYATGISNGGMLCYRLACEIPERIAAIGPVAGNLAVDSPPASLPMPIIHFHGMQDRNVPYAGGVGPNAILKIDHRSVPDSVAWFREANQFGETPEVESQREVEIDRYLPGPDAPAEAAPAVVYKVLEGGHCWPGGVDVTPHLDTGPLIESVPASELMWDFFSQFRRRLSNAG